MLSTIPEMTRVGIQQNVQINIQHVFWTMHAIEKGDSEYAQEIVHMDDEINRFHIILPEIWLWP